MGVRATKANEYAEAGIEIWAMTCVSQCDNDEQKHIQYSKSSVFLVGIDQITLCRIG